MLTTFQNEWDEVMAEVFTLRQHLEATRQELSQALYQHDAACRVIARLMVERDEARAMVTNLKQAGYIGAVAPSAAAEESSENPMDTEAPSETPQPPTAGGLDEAITTLVDTFKTLSAGRRGRVVSPSLAPAASIASYQVTRQFTPHKMDKSSGISCLTLNTDATMVLSGGLDKDCYLTDLESGKVLSKFTGHKKKVTGVALSPDFPSNGLAYSTSADCTMKVWKANDKNIKSSVVWNYTGHTAEISGLSLHSSGRYAFTSSVDGMWSFIDLDAQNAIAAIQSDASFQCSALHPDGLLLALGDTASSIQIW